MLTINEMLTMKKAYGLSYEYISEKSGVPLSTVQKVFSKTTSVPRRATIEALSRVFYDRDIVRHNELDDFVSCNIVCEEEAPYDPGVRKYNTAISPSSNYEMFDGTTVLKMNDNKKKTIDDYLKLPEGTRVELIDGVFYDMAAPTTIHQRIDGLIYSAFSDYIKRNKGKCIPFAAPTDVQLDCDDKTMVQPDVLVVCDRDKITRARIVGAPDLVIEILSDSNWYHDMVLKCKKYKSAGVREYWIVVPSQLTVLVYDFENNLEQKEYTFNDKIPVSIWDGKCEIDFKEIYEEIAFLLNK